MALDKLVDSAQLDADLTSVADAIRTKGGTSAQLAFPAGFVSAVQAIPTGGGGGLSLDDAMQNKFGSGKIEFASATYIPPYGCAREDAHYDSTITEISAPLVTAVGTYAFYNLRAVTHISLPLAKTFGGYAFYRCYRLAAIALPACTTVTNYTFAQALVTEADFTALTNIPANAFRDGTNLSTLILRKTGSIATLANISAFANTPFASGKAGGTLYVPQALISSYQSATNWSTILGYANNQIMPIEGSIYETQYADGTPIA